MSAYCSARIVRGDAAIVYEAARESVHEVGMWLPWCHAGYTMEESENWIKLCAKSWEGGHRL